VNRSEPTKTLKRTADAAFVDKPIKKAPKLGLYQVTALGFKPKTF
jgi:hypothetical protein